MTKVNGVWEQLDIATNNFSKIVDQILVVKDDVKKARETIQHSTSYFKALTFQIEDKVHQDIEELRKHIFDSEKGYKRSQQSFGKNSIVIHSEMSEVKKYQNKPERTVMRRKEVLTKEWIDRSCYFSKMAHIQGPQISYFNGQRQNIFIFSRIHIEKQNKFKIKAIDLPSRICIGIADSKFRQWKYGIPAESRITYKSWGTISGRKYDDHSG